MNKERMSGDAPRSAAALAAPRAALPNVAVQYMYRDFSNFKRYKVVSFSNPEHISATDIWRQINDVLESLMSFKGQPIFRPEWVGLPTAFLFSEPGCSRNMDDHDWHEIIDVEETDAAPMLSECSSISGFIEALRRTHIKSKS